VLIYGIVVRLSVGTDGTLALVMAAVITKDGFVNHP
jgi:hypothetical protein